MYTWKSDENGKAVKAKARLVARGFSQRPGVDYHETFASTPATPCIRLMAAISMRVAVGFVPFRCTTGFCPGRTEGSGPDADASGLRSTVRKSSSFESELIRLEISVTILA